MPAQLLTFHRSASAHKSRQVLVSSDLYIYKEWGFRVDDPAGADDHSAAETLQWVWCADVLMTSRWRWLLRQSRCGLLVLMQSRLSWRGAGGGARRCQSGQKKEEKNTCTQIKINHKDRQYMCTQKPRNTLRYKVSQCKKLCNDLRVLVFMERAEPPVCSEHIAYCVRVRISCVQHAAKWTWITIFLSQSEMCWNHLVLDTAGRVSTPQDVSSDHSEGSLMSQSVSLRALEDVQAYFSKNIYITIKDCRPLAGVLKAVLTWTEKNPLISNEQELKKELKPTVNT